MPPVLTSRRWIVVPKVPGRVGDPWVLRAPAVSVWNSRNRPPLLLRTNASLLYSLSLWCTTSPAHCQCELCARVIFASAVQSPAGTGWPAKLTGPVEASLMSPVVTGRFSEPPDCVIGLAGSKRSAHFADRFASSKSSDTGPATHVSGSLGSATGGPAGSVSIAKPENVALLAAASCDISKKPMSWVAAAPASATSAPTCVQVVPSFDQYAECPSASRRSLSHLGVPLVPPCTEAFSCPLPSGSVRNSTPPEGRSATIA